MIEAQEVKRISESEAVLFSYIQQKSKKLKIEFKALFIRDNFLLLIELQG